jgi:hypothetical protein
LKGLIGCVVRGHVFPIHLVRFITLGTLDDATKLVKIHAKDYRDYVDERQHGFFSDCKTYQQDQKMDDAQAGVQQNEMLAQQAAELNNLQTVQVNEMQQLEFAQQKLSVYTDRCNRLVLQEQQQQPQQQQQRPDPSSPQAEQQQTTTPTAILETLPPEPEPKPEPPYDAHRVRSTATGEEAETPRRYPRKLAADENGEATSAIIAADKRAVAAEAQREEAIEHATAVEGMLAAAVERAAAAEAQLATTIARAAAAEARAEALVTRADAAQDQRACVVCFEQPKSHAPPCLHLCCCKGCGIGLVECPICRIEVPRGGWRQVFV